MRFNNQQLKKIIQAPNSIDMKIDLIEQLHYQDVQETVSEKWQSILEGVEKVISNERNTTIESLEHENIDQFLPDALALAKKQKLTISYLQRNFKIGYNRANRLLAQCEQAMNEEEE